MPATLDFATIAEPLSGESPGGDATYFVQTFAPEVREMRREESPDQFDGATRPADCKKANWPAIVGYCEEALRTKARDLRIACQLIEALLHVDGLAGLRDGLLLLTKLIEESWESLLPSLDDNPAESRGTPLVNMVDDPDRGPCFPNQLRTLPLLGHEPNRASYTEWMRLRSSDESRDFDQLCSIREQAPPRYFQATLDELAACETQLHELGKCLEQHLGDDAPGFSNLREAIGDLKRLVADELSMLGVEPSTDDAGSPEPMPMSDTLAGQIAELRDSNREELYTLLDHTAERLRGMEPHSPIPYLVKRAVRLGRLPFPALMKQVIREEATLTELNREFGLAEPNGVAS